MKYTKESLEPVVQKSFSISEVLRNLNLKYAGGNHSHIKKKIDELGIDTSHFTGRAWNKGKLRPRNDWSSIFVVQNPIGPNTKGPMLRRGMVALGIDYQCSLCGQLPSWNGLELVLQVDHINGQRWDNRIENLRFLCPNCHTQTETFSGRSSRRGVVE